MSVATQLTQVREDIAQAARDAKRDPKDVALVAVSKRHPPERVVEAYACGQRDFGENTVQGLAAKAEALAEKCPEIRWHFIGKLQRNKINKLLPHVSLIHSIDSEELVQALDKRAQRPVDVLIEVNISHEEQKGGVNKTHAEALAQAVHASKHLNFCGVMGMPPAEVDPRPYFETLHRLGQSLSQYASQRFEYSMGMTADFRDAIACGATLVRIGTAIFGPRPQQGEAA